MPPSDERDDNVRAGDPRPPSLWEGLPTEARHPASHDLDRMAPVEVVEVLLAEDRRGLEAAYEHRGAIARVAEWVAETLAGNGTVFLTGAGTSGRLGVLEAAECPPTFGTDPARIQAAMAGGREAVFEAVEGAEDRAEDGRRAVGALGAGDLLIGLSASSVTPYTQGSLEEARRRGARTVLLTCAGPAGLDALADVVLALDTGPEILTGSTRLKAGSATKAALNAITTAAMVRLGKVFENWMVDLRAGSAKLRDRGVRIVAEAGEVSPSRAAELLSLAEGEVKTAVVMARRGDGPGEARRRLAAAGGSVRRALED